MTFEGFRSRWTTPAAFAKATGSQTLRKRRSLSGSAESCGGRGETLAPHELHRIEGASVREAACVVDGHETGVLEPGEDPRLGEKRLRRRLAVERHVDDLERETPSEQLVLHLEDVAHAARADARDEPVARAGEIGRAHRAPEPGERRVREPHAGGSVPSSARASARNSSSDAVSSRRSPRTMRRKSRRAAASWFVTSPSVVPNRSARSS